MLDVVSAFVGLTTMYVRPPTGFFGLGCLNVVTVPGVVSARFNGGRGTREDRSVASGGGYFDAEAACFEGSLHKIEEVCLSAVCLDTVLICGCRYATATEDVDCSIELVNNASSKSTEEFVSCIARPSRVLSAEDSSFIAWLCR